MTLISFLLFTIAVATATYFLTRKTEQSGSEGFFLAGRSLGPLVIAGSLLLTNLSTEQIVGLNGGAFTDGVVVTAWETLAGVSMAVLALVFLPRYLKSGITTTPEYLEKRFDGTTRLLAELLFLTGYVVILLPMVLASGALFMSAVFDVPALFGGNKTAAIWATVWTIGLIGSGYAVFGGLKGVAISDTINGFGLLVGGLMIPFYGLAEIAKQAGGSGIGLGWKTLTETNPEKFDAVVFASENPDVSIPFTTLFTGVILLHLFYWNTNQVIVQRTLAARSLADGQKGVLLAAFLKLLGPLVIVIPGIIAFHLYADQIDAKDEAYGTLVKNVLPAPLTGFFAAVIAGAILSSFNSGLNSAAALFSTGIYKKKIKPSATSHEMVKTGRLFSFILAVAAMLIGPIVALKAGGIFQYLQKANGCYGIPILAVMICALFTKRVPAAAAKFAIIFGSLTYLFFAFIITVPINELHLQGIIFALTMLGIFIIGKMKPRPEPFIQEHSGDVDIKPWRFAYPAAAITVTGAICTYVYFS
jgi:SSS family solute:Na+ symporter